MSDTPETDANIDPHLYNFVRAKFARKLERERDEAIDAMKTCHRVSREDCEQNAKRAEELRVQNLTLERERDEAREERDDAKTSSHEWAVHATRRIRERDEAREERKNSRQSLEVALEELIEAREALMKIEDLFVDGTDIYADRENMGLIARAALEGVE